MNYVNGELELIKGQLNRASKGLRDALAVVDMALVKINLLEQSLAAEERAKAASAVTVPAAITVAPKVEPVTSKPEPKPEPVQDEPLVINDEWKAALGVLNNGTSDVFLTGGAGVGKTTLLHQFVENCDKSLAVVASTGVAALRAGGQTCHSFFRLDIHALDEDDIKVSSDPRHVNKLKRLDTLILDEVSMLRADTMDAIDITLRKHRQNDLPYGGVRVISVGDPYQLPPVARESEVKRFLKDRYGTSEAYFFHSNVFRKRPPLIQQLTTVFRQQGNEQFINVLNAIRNGTATQEQLDLINSRVKPDFVPPTDELWITLTTTNASADIANQAMLDAIKSPVETFTAFTTGDFSLKDAPVDEVLRLKVGAAVMFAKNDTTNHHWVNGTLGRVTSVKPLLVEVKGVEYPVEREIWEKIAYEYSEKDKKLTKRVSGSFSQYPLKLAAAITTHKSQGTSLDRAIINLKGGVFANGQLYTALSRLRTLEGLVLRQPVTKHDLMTSGEVIAYMTGKPIALPAAGHQGEAGVRRKRHRNV